MKLSGKKKFQLQKEFYRLYYGESESVVLNYVQTVEEISSEECQLRDTS